MILKVIKEVDASKWTLTAFFGSITRWWNEEPFEFGGKKYTDIDEFEKDYPSLVDLQPAFYDSDPKEGIKTIKLSIELETGKVVNWPAGIQKDFLDDKIVDTGRYVICDENGKMQAGYVGYVPDCFEIAKSGWGDYLEFQVTENGEIVGWRFGQPDYDEFKTNDYQI